MWESTEETAETLIQLCLACQRQVSHTKRLGHFHCLRTFQSLDLCQCFVCEELELVVSLIEQHIACLRGNYARVDLSTARTQP
jgi:hypothetical protein